MHAFGLSSVSLPVFASFHQPAASRMQAMSRRRLEPAHSLAAR